MMMAPIDRKPMPRCPGHGHNPGIVPGIVSPQRADEFVFAGKDKNKDGNLSLDEWVRSKPGEVTMKDVQQFQRYDRNDDGQVSKDEFMKGRALDRWLRDAFDGVKDGWKEHVRPLFATKQA